MLCFVLSHAGVVYCQPDDLPFITARHIFDISSGFIYPSDVTVGAKGQIYIVDGVNNKVKIFDSEGAYLSSFGSKGKGNGQFNSPVGIDSRKDGTIFVADSGNQRIQAFDPAGRFLFNFTVRVKDSTGQPDPTDVVLDESTNRCYVVDNDNHRILVYTGNGSSLLDQWGTRGEKPGEFQFPFLAAMDRNSTLYVVDVLNTRVQAISKEGRTMAYIGKWGVDRGQFYRPKGVTIDFKDRIYISDSYLGVIQVFKRYRKFLGVVANKTGGILRFKTPVGIYVDDKLRLYVVEMLQNRVSVYQISE